MYLLIQVQVLGERKTIQKLQNNLVKMRNLFKVKTILIQSVFLHAQIAISVQTNKYNMKMGMTN